MSWCQCMFCHFFWGQNGGTNFHHLSWCWRGSLCTQHYVVKATVMIHQCVLLCSSKSMCRSQWEQSFRYPKAPFISHVPSCTVISQTFTLCSLWWMNQLLVVAFSCGTSQLTTLWLIGIVCVSVFKIFPPPSDTVDTYAGITTHTSKSPIDVCSWVIHNKEFSYHMLLKQYVTNSHFATVDCGNTSSAHVLDVHSYWRE
jgi:hypothetical protein